MKPLEMLGLTSLQALGLRVHPMAAIVTDDADGTTAALESLGVTFSMRALNTATLRHEPGSLGAFTRGLAENNINLQSIYIMSTDGDDVLVGYSTE